MYKKMLPPEKIDAMKRAEAERKGVMGSAKGPGKGKRQSMQWASDGVSPTVAREAYSLDDLKRAKAHFDARLKGLEAHMFELKQGNGAGFVREYSNIKDGKDKTALASKLPPHKKLNRYANISAYDWSRVKIKPTPPQNTDYINANYIDGFDHPSGYIASQGPLPATQASFWQMVWENKCEVIVMVTNEVEGGKTKCQRYWPDSPADVSAMGGSTTKTYGAYTVAHAGEKVFPNYIKRTFQVKYKGSARTITHFLYSAWPDHGVPNTTKELLGFRSTVKEIYNPENPMMVHCSAGVGRTGTFIGLDRYLDACAALDDNLGVLDIVRNMRASRNYMVQAQAQFTYLYSAAKDGLEALRNKVELALMSEQAAAEKLALEMEKEASLQQNAFVDRAEGEREMLLAEMAKSARPRRPSVGATVAPDVTQQHVKAVTYTSDIEVTQRVPTDVRKSSLHQATQKWVGRHNVPMSPEEHGYVAANSVLPIPTRLVALSDARAQWMTRYDEAERTWQAEHDAEGVIYDIGASLTPLESRVASLAASEEQWLLRSGSSTSAAEERARAELAELTLRLESLQYTVLNSERRWRARGDSSDRNPEMDEEVGVHTSDRLGGLGARLKMLASEQTKYQERDGWNPYDLQAFHEDIMTIAEEQEKLMEERAAAAEAEAEALAKIEAEHQAAQASEKAAVKKSKLEEKRKSDAKKKMVASSKFHGSYDHPTLIKKKAEEEEAKVAAKKAKEVAALQAREDEKAKKEEKKAKKSKAAKDAQKFLAKQKGKK
jgi:protein tyrosine phosphatase